MTSRTEPTEAGRRRAIGIFQSLLEAQQTRSLSSQYFGEHVEGPRGSFAGALFESVGTNPPDAISEGDLLAVSFLDTPFVAGAARRLAHLPRDSRAAQEEVGIA
jgi:hypothetical protein